MSGQGIHPGWYVVRDSPDHCRRGHAYTPENTIKRKDGERTCRECLRASQERAAERQRQWREQQEQTA